MDRKSLLTNFNCRFTEFVGIEDDEEDVDVEEDCLVWNGRVSEPQMSVEDSNLSPP
jgi:hypothetical protein